MNRPCFLLILGLACQAVMCAQIQQSAMSFQEADSLVVGRSSGINIIPLPRAEKGKPFSATATTQTNRTFLDGTHVGQTTTTMEYRDADGRVRTEARGRGVSSSAPPRSITIRDPVAGVTYRLDPAQKTAHKLTIVPVPAVGGRGGGGSGAGASQEAQHDQVRIPEIVGQPNQPFETAQNANKDIVENLGTATLNGVLAQGTRVTSVVPVGAIGNDREFRSVSERWFSPDLNLLIKSVNTDPRFGTTIFELTNIRRLVPDASLFQVPGDYKVVSDGVR